MLSRHALLKIAIHVPVHLLLHRLHLHLPLPEELALSTTVSEGIEAAGLRAWRWWRRRP